MKTVEVYVPVQVTINIETGEFVDAYVDWDGTPFPDLGLGNIWGPLNEDGALDFDTEDSEDWFRDRALEDMADTALNNVISIGKAELREGVN